MVCKLKCFMQYLNLLFVCLFIYVFIRLWLSPKNTNQLVQVAEGAINVYRS